MAIKFREDAPQYAKIVNSISRYRHWHYPEHDRVRCELDHGAVVYWWWETGTVLFQGPPKGVRTMKHRFLLAAGTLAVDC